MGSAIAASDKWSTTLIERRYACVVRFVEPVLTKSTVADSCAACVGIGVDGV
ncbi:MAG: hypothetical protein U0K66_00530 [Paludibacteraceae bacterium]|nr:hypothetical protein [Paludibacteraceae bacterium]